MSQVNDPHDKTFRAALANQQVAREFFAQHLPADIQQAIDVKSLQLCAESYIDAELQEQLTDVLYAVAIKGRPGYLYLLCEHQSKPDKWMAFRIIKYVLAIMDRHLKQHPKSKGLPLVYPLVFYNGRQRYRYSTDIKASIAAPKALIERYLFKPFQLIDANRLEDEALRERYWAGLMQFLFKHIYARDILPHVKQCLDLWQRIEQEGGTDYILTLVSYLSSCGESQAGRTVLELIAGHVSQPTGNRIMTIAERIRQEAYQSGRVEGIAEGEAAMLIKLLKRKFGSIPFHYLQQIQLADEAALSDWGLKLLDAERLQDIFEE